MAFKPIIIDTGTLKQLPTGEALDVGGWTLPTSSGTLGYVLTADAGGDAVWQGLANYLKADGTVPLTADWTTGAHSIIGSDHWYMRGDNTKLYFGASDTVSIYYDNVDMVIDPAAGPLVLLNTGNPRGAYANDFCRRQYNVSQIASGDYSTIGGGRGNTSSGDYSTVGGGRGNTSSAQLTTVCGGYGNTAGAQLTTVCGGYYNTAGGEYAIVVGGYYNYCVSPYAFIGGGVGCEILSDYGTVCGGYLNVIDAGGPCSTIGGGYGNTTDGDYATISGGKNNASGNFGTVSGGENNVASALCATAGGGYTNIASGEVATIGGGYGNDASGNYATIGGGDDNTASALCATVGGGQGNIAAGDRSIVGGGYSNNAVGDYATIAGGYVNVANSNHSTIGGGSRNHTNALYSMIPGGRYGKTTNYGQLAQAGGCFTNRGDAQTSVLVARQATTSNTPTEMKLNGSSYRATIATDTAWAFKILAVAASAGLPCTAMWTLEGLIVNDGGTLRYAGPGSTAPGQTLDYDAGAIDPLLWRVQPSAANNALIITVTGQFSVNIGWVARVELAEVTYPELLPPP